MSSPLAGDGSQVCTKGVAPHLLTFPVRRPFMGVLDVLCFSHLRWDFVFQRPNHLMSRFAREGRVFFLEEPVFDAPATRLEQTTVLPKLTRLVPHLPAGLSVEKTTSALREALARFC